MPRPHPAHAKSGVTSLNPWASSRSLEWPIKSQRLLEYCRSENKYFNPAAQSVLWDSLSNRAICNSTLTIIRLQHFCKPGCDTRPFSSERVGSGHETWAEEVEDGWTLLRSISNDISCLISKGQASLTSSGPECNQIAMSSIGVIFYWLRYCSEGSKSLGEELSYWPGVGEGRNDVSTS